MKTERPSIEFLMKKLAEEREMSKLRKKKLQKKKLKPFDEDEERYDAAVEEVSKMDRPPKSNRRVATPLHELEKLHKQMEEDNNNSIANEDDEWNSKESFANAYKLMMNKGKAFLCSIYVLEDPEISLQAKALFFIISSLSFNKGFCYGSNKYLASKTHVSVSTVKRYIKELQDAKLIALNTWMTGDGLRREIHLQFESMKKRYMKGVKED